MKSISYFLFRSDEDAATIAQLQKQLREIETQLEETREDCENEKQLRAKAERQRREMSDELENLKSEFMEASDKSALSQEIQKKGEEQLKNLQVLHVYLDAL